MAVIAATNGRQNGAFTVTRTALGASDTLTYLPRTNQVLELFNTTASPVVVTIDGSTSSAAYPVPGTGGTMDLTAGKAVTVPANGTVAIRLDTIAAYLGGTVAVTGGTGVTAHLYNN